MALGPLRKFFQQLRKELRLAETELVICFVTDLEMARMNEAFRKKQGPTDVLSFPAGKHRNMLTAEVRSRVARENSTGGVTKKTYLGDVAIAPGVARRNAKKYGRRLAMELRILMLHGVLHLLGYDHETDDGQMQRLEVKLRRRLGLTWGI
jgi:probable rRNA maturation factor